MAGLTLFSVPKPFVDPHIAQIQRNAAGSWLALGPEIEVLWIGDEPGLSVAAEELGIRQLAAVERNSAGTPLVSSIFELAEAAARHPLLAYLNADIVLLDDFKPVVEAVAKRFDRFLVVGQRWDLPIDSALEFQNGWIPGLRRRIEAEGQRHPPAGSDYFVFRRGTFGDLPPFALGRAGWDNWMIYAGRRMGIPVVDASQAITAIHQDHDYGHLPDGRPHYRLPESEENVRLGGGRQTVFNLEDATWKIQGGEIEKVRFSGGGFARAVESSLTARAGSSGSLRALRVLLHPSEFLRSRGAMLVRWIRALGRAPRQRAMSTPIAPTQTLDPLRDRATVTVVGCPLCQSSASEAFDTIREGAQSLSYRLCTNCGLVYQSPRMSEAALEDYYQAEYVTQHQRAEGVTEKELRIQSGRARHLLRLLRPQVGSIVRHLDLGCSAGILLEAVQEAYRCESIGIEPAEVYRNYCVRRGLTVYPDLGALSRVNQNRFDLVSMAHVLEHLADPLGYLSDLRTNWLQPGAKLLIEVPNLFGHSSFETPHLVCFHAVTLRRMLGAAGYRVTRLVRHGNPRSRLIPLYLTAIAEPLSVAGTEEATVSGANGVRLRRRLGMAWHRLATRIAPRWAWLPLPEMATDR